MLSVTLKRYTFSVKNSWKIFFCRIVSRLSMATMLMEIKIRHRFDNINAGTRTRIDFIHEPGNPVNSLSRRELFVTFIESIGFRRKINKSDRNFCGKEKTMLSSRPERETLVNVGRLFFNETRSVLSRRNDYLDKY